MTPGPNDLVVSPSEAGTMLNCHLSAPSPSPHHTHIPNRVLTYWRGYYIGPSGTFELECTPLMLWMWNISVPNYFPWGISKISFPFLTQDQVGFCEMTAYCEPLLGGSSHVHQGGWNISSLAQLHEGQQRLHMLDPAPQSWSPSQFLSRAFVYMTRWGPKYILNSAISANMILFPESDTVIGLLCSKGVFIFLVSFPYNKHY